MPSTYDGDSEDAEGCGNLSDELPQGPRPPRAQRLPPQSIAAHTEPSTIVVAHAGAVGWGAHPPLPAAAQRTASATSSRASARARCGQPLPREFRKSHFRTPSPLLWIRFAMHSGAAYGQVVPCSEKDAKLAQKSGQVQPFLAVLPPECVGQLASFGPT